MNNNIVLRSYTDNYLSDLYEVFSDQEQRLNILPYKQYVTKEQFETVFKRHIETKYAEFKIISNQDDCFMGFAIAYDYMRNDGHIKITVYLLPHYQHMGYGIFASAKFIDYLFSYYNIHKIFTEVYAFNEHSISIHNSLGLTKEACLKEYKFYNGEYYDMYIYSLNRNWFYSLCEKKHYL